MKKILKWGLPGFFALTGFMAQAQQINPMTEAVLRQYSDILAENPKDYLTLYDRASQYYGIGELVRALSDIDMALEYTPEKEKDYRVAEFSLKSDILSAQKDYEGALKAVKEALKLNPSSQPELYKAGNLSLLSNDPDEALKYFQLLQRENSRSQEAFYGLAKAYVMKGNNEEASKLLEEVSNIWKQSPLTYCRIGDLYTDMGMMKEATTNYAIAYSLEERTSRPLESLKLLARRAPHEIIGYIDELRTATTEDNQNLNYIKAILSYDNGLYSEAESACRQIAASDEDGSAAVYRMIALSQLAQNKIEDAKKSIYEAERLDPTNADLMHDKAEILMSTEPENALKAATAALSVNPDNEIMLHSATKAAILTGKYEDALNYLNNIILSNPGNAEALLLRGYVNSEYMKDAKAGEADYTRAGNIHQDGSVGNLVMAALGKAKTGKKLDSDGMINEAIQKAGNNKDSLYLIAVYYAQTGNPEKAKEFAEKAMRNGYNNQFNILSNNEPLFNLIPVRKLFEK